MIHRTGWGERDGGGLLIKGAIVASLAVLGGLIAFAPGGSNTESVPEEGRPSPGEATASPTRDLESFPVFRTPRERNPELDEEAPAYPDIGADGNEIPRGTPAL